MIKSIKGKASKRFVKGDFSKLPQQILTRLYDTWRQIDYATCVEDLTEPYSNQLEVLKGDRKGQWSIRINNQWRICFRFEDGNAYDVEIVDYH